MSRKRIPALPLPVKNLLELYGLTAELQTPSWPVHGWRFYVYNRNALAPLACVDPDASTDAWVATVVGLRRAGFC